MKLSLWMSVAALIAAGIVAPTASGARSASADEPELIEGACPFPVLVETTSEHGRTTTARLTNTLSGESVTVRIAGSATFAELPDGDIRTTARGQFLQFHFASDVGGPGIFHAKGRVVEVFDGSTGAITSSHVTGRRTDICAQLG